MNKLMPLLLSAVLCSLALVALAQPMALRGYHVVELPRASRGSTGVLTDVLLETGHLRLIAVVVPRGQKLVRQSSDVQLSFQVVAGVGEIKIANQNERLDTARALVLAPGIQHEISASADGDLSLLVHEIYPARRGMGFGVHSGAGRERGPGARPWSQPPQ